MADEKEPLGLPKGSVRAILTLAVVLSAILVYLMNGDAPDWLVSAFGTVIGFYFGTRTKA